MNISQCHISVYLYYFQYFQCSKCRYVSPKNQIFLNPCMYKCFASTFAVVNYFTVNTFFFFFPLLKAVLQKAGNWRSQNSGFLLPDDEWKTGTTGWVAVLLPQGHIADPSSICPPGPPTPFLQICSLASQSPACTVALGYYILSVKLRVFLCWSSQASFWPSKPTVWVAKYYRRLYRKSR